MKRTTFAFSLLITISTTRAAIGAPPAWCNTEGLAAFVSSGHFTLQNALDKNNVKNALTSLVGLQCLKESGSTVNEMVKEHFAELEAAHGYWSHKLELNESEWSDIAMWLTTGSNEDMRPDNKVAWSAYDGLEQYMKIAWPDVDTAYVADALGTRLTESGRLAYIEQCISSTNTKATLWAQCQPDIDAFQAKKIAPELRAGVSDCPGCGYQRTRVRIAMYRVLSQLASHAADVKKLIAQDEAYGKLFAISGTTRKDWESRWKNNAALLATVAEMDDARVTNSRKAFNGCEEKTWSAWAAAVAKIPAKEFENMHDEAGGNGLFLDKAVQPILSDPDAYLASVALVSCRSNSKHDRLSKRLAIGISSLPGLRVPRTAAMTAMLNAGIVLDDRNDRLQFPRVSRDWFGGEAENVGGSGGGLIASVKTEGSKVRVNFSAKMEQQAQCAEGRRTNRVIRIDDNGQLIYEVKCIKTKIVTVNTAPDPQTVDARYAGGLKPHVVTSIADGVAQAVWTQTTSPTPSYVFGVAVK